MIAILIGSIGLYLSWGLHGPKVPAVVAGGARAEFDPSTAARPEPSSRASKQSPGALPESSTNWEREDDEPAAAKEAPKTKGAGRADGGKSADGDGVGNGTSNGTSNGVSHGVGKNVDGSDDVRVQADLEALMARKLLIPVRGVEASDLRDSYTDPRSGGRKHLALDIMAPRNRKILAVEDGRIERLFQSNLGGITIYQRSADGRFIYYYAHLDRYARGLEEGEEVERGDVLGFVGSTGNAPDSAPHLHFAIYRGSTMNRWWTGEPINPYPVLVRP